MYRKLISDQRGMVSAITTAIIVALIVLVGGGALWYAQSDKTNKSNNADVGAQPFLPVSNQQTQSATTTVESSSGSGSLDGDGNSGADVSWMNKLVGGDMGNVHMFPAKILSWSRQADGTILFSLSFVKRNPNWDSGVCKDGSDGSCPFFISLGIEKSLKTTPGALGYLCGDNNGQVSYGPVVTSTINKVITYSMGRGGDGYAYFYLDPNHGASITRVDAKCLP
jgi:hypothetical protein